MTTLVHDTRLPARRRRDEPRMSLGSYLLHGSAWIGFMLFLFWLAGMKF
jgi:hypothetical protein